MNGGEELDDCCRLHIRKIWEKVFGTLSLLLNDELTCSVTNLIVEFKLFQYFTWNQIGYFLSPENYQSYSFTGFTRADILHKFTKIKNQSSEITKNDSFHIFDSLKLISRKIWQAEKFLNFHTVIISKVNWFSGLSHEKSKLRNLLDVDEVSSRIRTRQQSQ